MEKAQAPLACPLIHAIPVIHLFNKEPKNYENQLNQSYQLPAHLSRFDRLLRCDGMGQSLRGSLFIPAYSETFGNQRPHSVFHQNTRVTSRLALHCHRVYRLGILSLYGRQLQLRRAGGFGSAIDSDCRVARIAHCMDRLFGHRNHPAQERA